MILYIGNKLSQHGFSPTSVETLGRQLQELTQVISVSDKRNKLLRLLDVMFAVVRNCCRVKMVLIDTYSTSNFIVAFTASQLCRLLRIPYVPILRGGSLPHRLVHSRRLSQMLFCNSIVTISPSTYLEYEFRSQGYGNIVVIPNNIDIGQYPFKLRKHFSPRLLWVRAFDKIYNCEMAIDVLASLLQRFPEAELCMVGPDKDGSLEAVKAKALEMGVSQSLKLTGKLNKTEWHELSKNYDIFISTTNVDNTPVSVIEAMALGLAVVSTNVGGVPYLIENGVDGYCTPKADVEAMTETIVNIIENDKQSQQISVSARVKVEGFDWKVVKEKWRTIISNS